MAVDEAILEAVQHGQAPPTLRLYSWEPACLSLGYAQSIRDVDTDALAVRTWDLVRRPTGGRAILHTDELTYSVIAPAEEPRLAGGVLESYRQLSAALLEGLRLLGVPAEGQSKKDAHSDGRSPNPVCFEVPSDYEIVVRGKKLVGSAQARRKKVVLQHGSIPLYGDIDRITQVLHYPSEAQRSQAAQRVTEKAITVQSAIQKRVSWEQAAEAIARGFSNVLNLEFASQPLSSLEEAGIQKWLEEKYANPAWTERV